MSFMLNGRSLGVVFDLPSEGTVLIESCGARVLRFLLFFLDPSRGPMARKPQGGGGGEGEGEP